MQFVFDTGSSGTSFSKPYLDSRGEGSCGQGKPFEARYLGVGGERSVKAQLLERASLKISGLDLTLSQVAVEMEPLNEADPVSFGRIGVDLFEPFERVTLDFQQMRLVLE